MREEGKTFDSETSNQPVPESCSNQRNNAAPVNCRARLPAVDCTFPAASASSISLETSCAHKSLSAQAVLAATHLYLLLNSLKHSHMAIHLDSNPFAQKMNHFSGSVVSTKNKMKKRVIWFIIKKNKSVLVFNAMFFFKKSVVS